MSGSKKYFTKNGNRIFYDDTIGKQNYIAMYGEEDFQHVKEAEQKLLQSIRGSNKKRRIEPPFDLTEKVLDHGELNNMEFDEGNGELLEPNSIMSNDNDEINNEQMGVNDLDDNEQFNLIQCETFVKLINYKSYNYKNGDKNHTYIRDIKDSQAYREAIVDMDDVFELKLAAAAAIFYDGVQLFKTKQNVKYHPLFLTILNLPPCFRSSIGLGT